MSRGQGCTIASAWLREILSLRITTAGWATPSSTPRED